MAHRDRTIKHIGARVSAEKYAAIEGAAEKLGLNLQKTVEAALDALLANSGVAIPAPVAKPPRRGSAFEQMAGRLDRIEAALVSPVGDNLSRLSSSNERLHKLIQARVVEVANKEEQELLYRIVHVLHVTGFSKKLTDLLREVEAEHGKQVVKKTG